MVPPPINLCAFHRHLEDGAVVLIVFLIHELD